MRLFKLLLYLYPSAFRTEYGEEMCRVFTDRQRDASGALSSFALGLEISKDTLLNALAVHWDLFRQDIGYTVRSLSRSAGFATAVVAVTALGIGAVTAVFSVTDQVLIRPLPFADSERLVKLWEKVPRYSRLEPSPANYRDWSQMSSVFETMAAFQQTSVNLVGQSEPVRLEAAVVTGELFRMLGVQPVMGRFLTAEDDREGAPDTALLSYGLWQSAFGGSEQVVGQSLRLDGMNYTVVGVMPPDFYFPYRDTGLWVALRLESQDFEDRDNNFLQVLAKLAPGVSLEQARAEMDVVSEQLEVAYPKENAKTRANVLSLREEISVQSRLLLAALAGASICLLLITCTNLANLLLARAIERRKELNVRTALGAGRERLVRQLLTESSILAVFGGALGVMVATAAVPLLARLVPTYLPMGEVTAIDGRVLIFAALLTCITAVGFGVLPAIRSCSGFDVSGLREDTRGGGEGQKQRLRSALVVVEVTASVVLLISSGLLIRALWQIQDVDPGFRTEGVVALHTPLPTPKYAPTSRRTAFYSNVLSEVRAMPGVSQASFISFLPMVMTGGIWPVGIDGLPEGREGGETASLRFITSGFFETMGIPLRLGRDVSSSDIEESPFVAVVSESFVRKYWPDRDPLGQKFNFAFRDRIVIGVVGDIRVRGLERSSEPQVYLPHQQVPDGGLIFYSPKELVIRSSGETEPLMAAVRKVIRRADPELPVSDVRTFADVVGAQTAPRVTQIRVLGAFAGLSLLLAGIGIYGLLSFAVSQRRSEIGLRIALGARSGDILTMVLREGALLAALGAGLGATLGYAAGRAMEALLAGVQPGDTVTYLTAVGVALLMTVSGSILPALRAVRVDPTRTLRTE